MLKEESLLELIDRLLELEVEHWVILTVKDIQRIGGLPPARLEAALAPGTGAWTILHLMCLEGISLLLVVLQFAVLKNKKYNT